MLYYFYFGLSEIKVKTEAFWELLSADRSQYKTVAIPVNTFKKNTDEIWVDGKLYDIASYHIFGDSVYISILHDIKEEQLVNINTEHFSQGSFSLTMPDAKHQFKKNMLITDDWKICNSQVIQYLAITPGTSFYTYRSGILSDSHTRLSYPPPDHKI